MFHTNILKSYILRKIMVAHIDSHTTLIITVIFIMFQNIYVLK